MSEADANDGLLVTLHHIPHILSQGENPPVVTKRIMFYSASAENPTPQPRPTYYSQ